MKIVFVGPPGAGKGTQCKRLARELKLMHISTGDMLRDASAHHTSLGKLADQYMSAGMLVPDELVLNMIGERLSRPDAAGGVVFDGLPRTVAQAEALDRLLEEHGTPLNLALELSVPDEEVVARLSNRGRSDDKQNVVVNRLNSYHCQTQPLLDYYRRRGILESVDGLGSEDEVSARIVSVVDNARRRGPRE